MSDRRKLCWYNIDDNSLELADGKFISTKQLEALRQKSNQDKLMKSNDMKFVWFLFNYGDRIFKDMNISPSNITRLFYTATFCGYDNVLKDNKRTLTKTDLKLILRISDTQFKNFWNELISNQILIPNDDKSISINVQFFTKGSINKNVESNFTRIYCKFIRDTYEHCDIHSHKILSYFFRLIPYTNYKYNCICQNPYESESNKIIPMTVENYCAKLDYNEKNGKRLLQQMLNFTVNGEHLMCVFGFSLNIKKNMLMINPRLFYSDSRFDEIDRQFKLGADTNEILL